MSGQGALVWGALIAPACALAGVLATILYGIYSARWTLRANLFSSYRLKWIDLFREALPELLILGERLYDPVAEVEGRSEAATREALRAAAKRLIVLMGSEDALRLQFAEMVRRFACDPTADLSDELEVIAQKIFRERWNQVRTETGRPARDKSPLPRPVAVFPAGEEGAQEIERS